jgi:Uma2 family endonuclease
MAVPVRRFTFDDLRALPDDGRRFELIEGGLVELPGPLAIHQVIQYLLHGLMDRHVVERELGIVMGAPFDVKLNDFNSVQPDICFVAVGRLGVVGRGFVDGAPDLVVEILSPSTSRHDRQTKRDLYERFGVREYLVVDPETERVLVHRLVDGRYQTLLDDQGRIRSAVIDGFELHVPAMLAAARRRLALVGA